MNFNNNKITTVILYQTCLFQTFNNSTKNIKFVNQGFRQNTHKVIKSILYKILPRKIKVILF